MKYILLAFVTSLLTFIFVSTLYGWLWLNGQIQFKQDKSCRQILVGPVRVQYYHNYAVIDRIDKWYRVDFNDEVHVSDHHPWDGLTWHGADRVIINEWGWIND